MDLDLWKAFDTVPPDIFVSVLEKCLDILRRSFSCSHLHSTKTTSGQRDKAVLGPRLILQVLQISCTPQGKTNAHLHSAKVKWYREKGMSAEPAFI